MIRTLIAKRCATLSPRAAAAIRLSIERPASKTR